MVSVVERWDIHPELPWLRGIRPDPEVERIEQLNAWCVYGYEDVYRILTDPKTFSNKTYTLAAVQIDESYVEGDMTQMDPPENVKYRKLVSGAFTPKLVASMESRITAITDELLDVLAAKDRADLVADLAYPLPVIVIAELLGIPASDRDMFIQHSTKVIEQMNGLSFLAEDAQESVDQALEEFQPLMEYMRAQIAERRERPRDDVLSHLTTAEVNGARLTDNEVVNIANFILGAGHIPTTLMLGSAVVCLDGNPEQFAMIREDRSLVPGAIEEVLRVLSPTSMVSRRTTVDVELSGVRIPAEQMVLPMVGAANLDPRKFENPEVFDVTRDPNPHLGFGHGAHFCIGSHLARMEGRIALNRLMDRFPKLYIDPTDPPVFFPTPDLIGVQQLPIRVD
jgi:cytochrome P450